MSDIRAVEDFRRMWSSEYEDWLPEERFAMNALTLTLVFLGVVCWPAHAYPVVPYELYLFIQRAAMGLYAGLCGGVVLTHVVPRLREVLS